MSHNTAKKPQAYNKDQPKQTTYSVDNDALAIGAMVNNAAKRITPVWPLEKFIACNPLHGFESMSFEEAVIHSETATKRVPFDEKMERVNWHMIKWCGSFLDIGQGTIEMPHRDKGFYFGFLKLSLFDKTLHQNNHSTKTWLLNLPESAEQAIQICLKQLNVLFEEQEEFIQSTLSHLPGWAGYIKWISEWKNRRGTEENPVTLLDFLAVRLVITCLLWPEAAKEKKKKKIIQRLKNLYKK